jgi:hypothetical protein
LLHNFDAILADDREDIEEMGEAEKIANLLAQVSELEAGSGGFGSNIEANESAEAGAVGVPEIGEIEDDAFVIRNERANAVEEDIGDARDQLSVAAHNDAVGAVFHLDGKDGRHCGVGHGSFLLADPGGWRSGAIIA